MSFISRFNPKPAVADFWSEFTRPQPYRIPILLASVAATGVLIFAFTQEKVVLPPERPQVTYITTFAPGRTDEEIRAGIEANQERKDALAAALAEREERKRELYRALGRASGMDVDAMEAELAAEEAAAAQAEPATGPSPAATSAPAETETVAE